MLKNTQIHQIKKKEPPLGCVKYVQVLRDFNLVLELLCTKDMRSEDAINKFKNSFIHSETNIRYTKNPRSNISAKYVTLVWYIYILFTQTVRLQSYLEYF